MKTSPTRWIIVVIVALCVIPVLVIRGLPVPGMTRDYSSVTIQPAERQLSPVEMRYETLKSYSLEQVKEGIDHKQLTETDLMLLMVRALSYDNRPLAELLLSRTKTPRLISFGFQSTTLMLFNDAHPEMIALFVRYRLDDEQYEYDGLTLREHYEKRYDQLRVMAIDRAERVRAGEEAEVPLGQWVQTPKPSGRR